MISTRKVLLTLSALILLGACANTVRADEIDNPRFKAWAGFKEGSSETLTGTMTMGQMQLTMEIKTTLKEVKDDHVTLERVVTTSFNGQSRPGQPVTETVNAKGEAKDINIKQLDDEDVDAMGKTFKCKVYTATVATPAQGQQPAGTGEAKIWANKDIPGGCVKMETKAHRPGAAGDVEMTMTYLLKEYEAK